MPETLLQAVRRHVRTRRPGQDLFETVVPGLLLLRANHPRPPSHRLFKPALCVVVQGAKWTTFGRQRFDYRAGQALVVSMELPSHGRVVEATPDKPYLCAVVEFDLAIMREVLERLRSTAPTGPEIGSGVFVTDFAGPLEGCVLRLVQLLDAPAAIPVLYPALMRELCYWLLAGPRGGDIARVVLAKGHDRRVLAAVHDLRRRFAEPIRVEELARIAHLSASAFHRQFKALTAMTPLQYQKRLRLLEARNRLLADAGTSEAVASQVGYASASQFNREYTRFFGAPPRRDVARLRAPLLAIPRKGCSKRRVAALHPG